MLNFRKKSLAQPGPAPPRPAPPHSEDPQTNIIGKAPHYEVSEWDLNPGPQRWIGEASTTTPPDPTKNIFVSKKNN